MSTLRVNYKVGTVARRVLTGSDFTWDGCWRIPSIGASNVDAGSTAYMTGALAVRYVSGARRYLSTTFRNVDYQAFGDLVEFQAPEDPTKYTGTTYSDANPVRETRRWADFTLIKTDEHMQDSNGTRIGGLYWDEVNGVIWYTFYGYYSASNMPFLGATQLLDTDAGGGYCNVGTKYGPWWYRENDPEAAVKYWKTVCNWMCPVPSSAQADLGGRKLILGGTVGSVAGEGHFGPGFHAIADFPSLSDPADTEISLGLRLADYTSESTQSPVICHRDNDYFWADGGGTDPNGSVGYWCMSLDQINSFVWVETATKHGIVLFGRQASDAVWYGHTAGNPIPAESSSDNMEHTDNTEGSSPGGYTAETFIPAIYIFDPSHVREVGRETRSPYADGMAPAVYNWTSSMPNLPRNTITAGPAARPIYSWISNTAYWDSLTSEIIYVQPGTAGTSLTKPTINFISVA